MGPRVRTITGARSGRIRKLYGDRGIDVWIV